MKQVELLEEKLLEYNYFDLYQIQDTVISNKVWNNGKQRETLKKVIQSSDTSLKSKFLAATVLLEFDNKIDTVFYKNLSNVYSYALRHTSEKFDNSMQLNGNLWGFLYEEDDLGELGKQYVSFGNEAIPSLMKLLEDTDNKIFYDGSEGATIGNSYQYRIKDFAAFYISKIKNIPMTFYQDFDKRDAEIERLQELLENE
ncbi:hypothetical protein [Kordia jejudonensis]|uniref:hypothetical protein n=1 Tax=Kordia jejudonensis TaxID=1348245 RepID=UPI000699E501|nr:hypothetical protein [Kordia jejudonensis]